MFHDFPKARWTALGSRSITTRSARETGNSLDVRSRFDTSAGNYRIIGRMASRPSEDELIARFFAPIAGEAGLALKDDVARLAAPPDRDLILTADALVYG